MTSRIKCTIHTINIILIFNIILPGAFLKQAACLMVPGVETRFSRARIRIVRAGPGLSSDGSPIFLAESITPCIVTHIARVRTNRAVAAINSRKGGQEDTERLFYYVHSSTPIRF